MAISFFAMPKEQLEWLATIMHSHDVWCWVRRSQPTTSFLANRDQICESDFVGEDVFEYDLGNHRISSALFKEEQKVIRLDFVRSQCVQFEPSRLLKDNTLLCGQLAISPRWAYEKASVDYSKIAQLYKSLQQSLRKEFSRENLVTQQTTLGTTKEWRNMYLTKGAIEFWRGGGLLKQFVEGVVTFGVGRRSPVQKRRSS